MKRTFTLKQRIVLMFLCCMLVMFTGIFVLSNGLVDALLRNKIDAGYQSGVGQLTLMLENVISNLNHVSQQLVAGQVAGDLDEYLKTEEPYQKIAYANQVRETLNLLTFTNPNVGLTIYVDPQQNKPVFSNGSVSRTFDLQSWPVLADTGAIRYLGPGYSVGASSDRLVIAALRSLELSESRTALVYIESSFRTVDDILRTNPGGDQFPLLFLDGHGKVIFSQAPQAFPLGSAYAAQAVQSGYHCYVKTTGPGWSLAMLVPTGLYLQERNRWMEQLFLLCAGIAALCTVMALALWRTIYRPLRNFDRKIGTMLDRKSAPENLMTNIPEYDYLLDRFEQMKVQIQQMIEQIQRQEQRRANLEIEKLRYQINPHFLMNALNSLHWLAVMNNQENIDAMVQGLNRLLLYNLNKENRQATLAQEVQAVREYLLLQQARYDFTFSCEVLPAGEPLEYCCPKFILQPLVENALFHGYRRDMHVGLRIRVAREIVVEVTDDGLGMAEDQRRRVDALFRSGAELSEGMGIGLHYVVQSIRLGYGGRAELTVESRQNKGTVIGLRLPKEMEEDYAERTDRR